MEDDVRRKEHEAGNLGRVVLPLSTVVSEAGSLSGVQRSTGPNTFAHITGTP